MGSGTRHVTAYADGVRVASFDWGDGSPPDANVSGADPSQSPVATHTYQADGQYTVTVKSSGGQQAAKQATVPGAAATRRGRGRDDG